MSRLKNPPVPFLDLSEQFKALESEWLESVRTTGSSGSFVLGPNVTAFECEFAQYVGIAHAVALANGTDALTLSLRGLDIGAGDEVITTPYTFFASAEAITHVGATPVFVDIERDSFNLNIEQVESRITRRTKAILPVHLFGYPVDMTRLMALARSAEIAVVEDCAQACGARHSTQRVGAFGTTAGFSFYPTKILGCYGDGGMVATDDQDLAARLRQLRNHGAVEPFVHADTGYNSRLDEIQAALLRIKLRSIEDAIRQRQRVAEHYTQRFAATDVVVPATPENGTHVFNLYTIRIPRRDQVRQRLQAARIGNSVCYPLPLHLQDVYRDLGYSTGDLPVSEDAAGECLSLPIYPELRPEQIDIVCELVLNAI